MRILTFLLFTSTLLAAPAFSVTDQERAVLQRLHNELKAAEQIIMEAEQAENATDRRQVDYQQLRDDLEQILQGIADVVDAKRREPRDLPPIEGDYL